MTPVFKKLNFKEQASIHAIQAPDSFQGELQEMSTIAKISTNLVGATEIEFAIVFVTTKQEIDTIIKELIPKMIGDPIVWFCYPKGTSKKYTCAFNRDNGWGEMGKYDLEPVRQVAIDEDWSALRFRKIAFIKHFTRNAKMVLSEKGKNRAAN